MVSEGPFSPSVNVPEDLSWEKAPFRGRRTRFQHSLVLVLGDCVEHLKRHRDATAPKTCHHTGVFPLNFSDLIVNYQTIPTKKIAKLETHLRARNLLQPITLEDGIGFPFINDAVADHFLRGLVEFFRALQAAIGDKKLRHEFGGELAQHIFVFL